MNQSQKKLPIRLIVGLGNPGAQYLQTRHNAGFWFVDLLARRYNATFHPENKFHGHICRIQMAGHECWLLKPMTYMNRSGQAVSSVVKYYKIECNQMLVVHDELDIPAGSVRLKLSGGHAGHNGLRDIMSAMAGCDFWRMRIGIDRPASSRDVVDYVLNRPSRDDRAAIDAVIDEAADLVPQIVAGQFSQAMNRLHSSC